MLGIEAVVAGAAWGAPASRPSALPGRVLPVTKIESCFGRLSELVVACACGGTPLGVKPDLGVELPAGAGRVTAGLEPPPK